MPCKIFKFESSFLLRTVVATFLVVSCVQPYCCLAIPFRGSSSFKNNHVTNPISASDFRRVDPHMHLIEEEPVPTETEPVEEPAAEEPTEEAAEPESTADDGGDGGMASFGDLAGLSDEPDDAPPALIPDSEYTWVEYMTALYTWFAQGLGWHAEGEVTTRVPSTAEYEIYEP